MNDNELSTAVRESVAEIHSATPVARIISRGRSVRARRRIPRVAGTLIVAAGAGLALPMLLPSGHPDSHPARIQLDAWTVAKQANGDIDVTIKQLKNPAGLQSTLRADGLPVNVTFSDSASDDFKVVQSASCRDYDLGLDVLNAVFHNTYAASGSALVINPSALPSGVGVNLFVAPHAEYWTSRTPAAAAKPLAPGTIPPHSQREQALMIEYNLVHTSQQCTG